MTPNLSDWMNLAVTQDPRDHDPCYPRIQTKKGSVFKAVESHGSLSKRQNKCNANVILNKFSYRKCLLFAVYKYLICRFYIARQLCLCILQNCGNKV